MRSEVMKKKSLVSLGFLLLWSSMGHSREIPMSTTNLVLLYNQHRMGQPQFVPWAGDFFPYSSDGIAKRWQGKSPTEQYDLFHRLEKRTTNWEKKNHSCRELSGSMKESCEGWWGHCNAWAAAAITEKEPRTSRTVQGVNFRVGDLKAYLTELWMESDAGFLGNTQKDEKTGKWVEDRRSDLARRRISGSTKTYYDAFWDVTPREFFLSFTNTIGIMKQSVVIDRFTGDEVWNQPIAGYRILPLRVEDLKSPEKRGSSTVYPVEFRMKIYWAKDDVEPDHLSSNFQVSQTTDQEWDSLPRDYEQRLLKFVLFFNAPVILEGERVVKAGRMVGPGVWDHQVNPSRYRNLDDTHPDFIWMPTNLFDDPGNEYMNTQFTEQRVYQITR
jgi:hypothetical protein